MNYQIRENHIEDLESRIGKLARRANKLNCEQISFRRLGSELREEIICKRDLDEVFHKHDDSCPKAYVRYYEVELVGATPKIAGWELLARLQHAGEAGTIVRCVPGYEAPARYRDPNVTPGCDHCQLRRTRKDTFLVRNEQGDIKEIGSDCIKDFLGHADPHAIAIYLEALAAADAYCRMSAESSEPHAPHLLNLEGFLTMSAAWIREYGWCSRGKAREDPSNGPATADQALDQFLGARRTGRFQKWATTIEADYATAQQALAWAQAIDPHDPKTNDYLANIHIVAMVPAMEIRSAGLAASIVSSWRREQSRKEEEEHEARTETSRHVGTIGERTEFTITVTAEPRVFEGEWGFTYLYTFRDIDGNLLKWFASCPPREWDSVREGTHPDKTTTCRIKGTVKSHSEYKGRKETILSRVKVLG